MKSGKISTLWHHPFVMVGLAIALILLGIGAAYMVWLNMLRDQERLNPSTERLLEVGDGQRIPSGATRPHAGSNCTSHSCCSNQPGEYASAIRHAGSVAARAPDHSAY
jgi:hypothetical protein